VNGDTASAAEILASALQGHGVATVVGARTFGKGVFQEVIELEGGAALDLTVGEYLTSEGDSLAGEGLAPDVRAPDDPKAEGDEALERARLEIGREIQGGS
jgi:carboxyl-terminal processing protease